MDGDRINKDIKDYLAMTLIDDWKRFGCEVLNDNKINMIDKDENGVYGKCFEMLTQWERKNEEFVTIGMVEQILMRLKRNDIWMMLKESKLSFRMY